MRPLDQIDVFEAMEASGGSFIKALAGAMRAADLANLGRLVTAFHDYWEQYANLARRRLAEQDAGLPEGKT